MWTHQSIVFLQTFSLPYVTDRFIDTRLTVRCVPAPVPVQEPEARWAEAMAARDAEAAQPEVGPEPGDGEEASGGADSEAHRGPARYWGEHAQGQLHVGLTSVSQQRDTHKVSYVTLWAMCSVLVMFSCESIHKRTFHTFCSHILFTHRHLKLFI